MSRRACRISVLVEWQQLGHLVVDCHALTSSSPSCRQASRGTPRNPCRVADVQFRICSDVGWDFQPVVGSRQVENLSQSRSKHRPERRPDDRLRERPRRIVRAASPPFVGRLEDHRPPWAPRRRRRVPVRSFFSSAASRSSSGSCSPRLHQRVGGLARDLLVGLLRHPLGARSAGLAAGKAIRS